MTNIGNTHSLSGKRKLRPNSLITKIEFILAYGYEVKKFLELKGYEQGEADTEEKILDAFQEQFNITSSEILTRFESVCESLDYCNDNDYINNLSIPETSYSPSGIMYSLCAHYGISDPALMVSILKKSKIWTNILLCLFILVFSALTYVTITSLHGSLLALLVFACWIFMIMLIMIFYNYTHDKVTRFLVKG